jgi:importin subunit alpha-1
MDTKKNRRDFKKGINLDDNRRRREENSVKLRKDSKMEGLAKRRNTQQISICNESCGETQAIESSNDMIELMQGLQSNSVEDQKMSLRAFRRLLSLEKNPPVQRCIDLGLVPVFVRYLHCDNPELQFEAAWALTNIASTDKTRTVVENNAVPSLIQLLLSPNADIREQCAWCLGNIAGDSHEYRDYILAQGALQPLLINIAQPASPSLLRNCVWTLSNFCRGKPQIDLEIIAHALPTLANVIIQQADIEAVVDATWALSYISDGDDRRIQSVINLQVIPSLIKMIESGNASLIVPSLRTIGNIVSGNDKQTQAVIDQGVLPALSHLLHNAKKSIRKETCWVLSNIAAGTEEQLNSLFNAQDLIKHVLHQLSASVEWDVRKEAAWVICNVITSSKKERLFHIVELGAIQPLCDLLSVGEPKIILIALDGLETLLKTSETSSSFPKCTLLIDEAGGIDTLEKLQEHENTKVYEKAVKIIERFFGVEDDAESENFKPQISDNTFKFGLNSGVSNQKSISDGHHHSNHTVFSHNFNF